MEIDAKLDTAHRVYRESERMIANRAVQLSEMLKASGVEEGADDVLADLAAVCGGNRPNRRLRRRRTDVSQSSLLRREPR